MSTKISATVKAVLRDGGETAIVLVLEKPLTASFDKDERVYVELTSAVTGDKVGFFPAPADVISDEEEDEESGESVAPVEKEKVVEPIINSNPESVMDVQVADPAPVSGVDVSPVSPETGN